MAAKFEKIFKRWRSIWKSRSKIVDNPVNEQKVQKSLALRDTVDFSFYFFKFTDVL